MICLQLETISTCNGRCHFCPYAKNMPWRAGQQMDTDLVHKILDEALTIDEISYIMYHGLNEPLLDKRLEGFIDYARSKKPSVGANIFTNGVYLYPERFESLKEAGICSIVVSLNAINQEQHYDIMGIRGKFQQTVDNIDYAIKNKKKGNEGDVSIEVHAVLNNDQFNEMHLLQFISRWGLRDNGGYGFTVVEANWAGDNRTTHGFDPAECCSRATRSIYVMHTGEVTMCCQDPLGETVFGDLKTQTIKEVYNSEKYSQFRKDHVADKADRWEQCRKCTRI